MPPKLWQRVKYVVHHALEMDPGDWPRYLQKSCNGDDKVLDEARSLLEVSSSIGDFIEVPVKELLRRELTRH